MSDLLSTRFMQRLSRCPDAGACREVLGVSTAADLWPVGSLFLSVMPTNPATLLGFGTWSPIAAGRMLVGIDSSDLDFDTVRETGGSKTHVH